MKRKIIYAFAAAILMAAAAAVFAQTSDREKGIEFFKKGDLKNAADVLRKFTKQNSDDYLGFYYLGAVLERADKLKDAENALEKSVALKPEFADSQAKLAIVYLRRGKEENTIEAIEKAIALDNKNAVFYYVRGLARARKGKFLDAADDAVKTVELDSKLADAYLLKVQALQAYGAATGKFDVIAEKYGKNSTDIGKYIVLTFESKGANISPEERENLKFFADYYKNQKDDDSDKTLPNETNLEIISKPKPQYTDRARQGNVKGSISLLVGFEKDGSIKHILPLNNLGAGLDQQATKAAREMKFTPATRDGIRVTVVKTVIFSFDIY